MFLSAALCSTEIPLLEANKQRRGGLGGMYKRFRTASSSLGHQKLRKEGKFHPRKNHSVIHLWKSLKLEGLRGGKVN